MWDLEHRWKVITSSFLKKRRHSEGLRLQPRGEGGEYKGGGNRIRIVDDMMWRVQMCH